MFEFNGMKVKEIKLNLIPKQLMSHQYLENLF